MKEMDYCTRDRIHWTKNHQNHQKLQPLQKPQFVHFLASKFNLAQTQVHEIFPRILKLDTIFISSTVKTTILCIRVMVIWVWLLMEMTDSTREPILDAAGRHSLDPKFPLFDNCISGWNKRSWPFQSVSTNHFIPYFKFVHQCKIPKLYQDLEKHPLLLCSDFSWNVWLIPGIKIFYGKACTTR